jgi:hypothetical protein
MFAEEEFLREKFGAAYLEWASRTPAFLPRLRNWRKPEFPFSVRKALKREYQTVFVLICSFTTLEVVGDVRQQRRFVVDPVWAVVFGAGLVFFIVVRYLRKKTDVLDVPVR